MKLLISASTQSSKTCDGSGAAVVQQHKRLGSDEPNNQENIGDLGKFHIDGDGCEENAREEEKRSVFASKEKGL